MSVWGGTGWERQTEVPHGFQDAKHEVKHGPLGRTGPLGAATRMRNNRVFGHVKRRYPQLSTRRGAMSDHTCVKTNTHILSARRPRHTGKEARKGSEVYSQAQNAGTELELQPDGL